jgi:hypothetical protein
MRIAIDLDSLRICHVVSTGVFAAWLDTDIDRIEVQHDGRVSWDELQAIKCHVWGDRPAVEVYPAAGEVVSSGFFRHLWRWGGDPALLPSLLDEGSRE